MPLFTFIMEYRGGTYMAQIRAENYLEAPAIWAAAVDWSVIPKSGKKFQAKLFAEVSNEEPLLLDGFVNAWCITALVRKKVALINFVQTDESAPYDIER